MTHIYVLKKKFVRCDRELVLRGVPDPLHTKWAWRLKQQQQQQQQQTTTTAAKKGHETYLPCS